jgi:hypothetical protein
MTNLLYTPLLIYSFYPTPGSPTDDGITPQRAASTNVVATNSLTPIWRNIVISNVVATAGQPGMIWARAELPASNILLSKFNVTASDSANSSFKLYSVRGVQVVDCQFQGPGGTRKFDLFNAGVTFSNTSPAAAISLNGFAVTNPLAFYNQPASLTDATIFDANALSLGGSTLSNGTSLTLASTTLVNFTLGTNAARAAATGNLTLSNTLNITNGFGFGAGTYTLFTYTGSFSGSPSLGTTPAGYNYSLTNGAGKVNLVVTLPCVNPTATVSGGGTVCGGSSANIQAALTGTGPWNVTWSDGVVQSGVGTTPAVRSVSPAMTTNYTVTSLSDATGCPTGTINGSATVTVCVIAPFQITSANLMSPDQFVLTWDSLSNLTYQVQSSDSISPAVWTTDAVMTALGPALSWTNTGVSTAPRRFYRVVYIP